MLGAERAKHYSDESIIEQKGAFCKVIYDTIKTEKGHFGI